jgi:hypothetical protein
LLNNRKSIISTAYISDAMIKNIVTYLRASGAVARLYVVSLFFLVFVTFSNSVIAGEEWIAMQALVLLLIFAAAVWVIHLLLWVFYLRKTAATTITHPWRYWSFGPLMTVLAFVVIWSGAFRWIRFVISEPFLRSEAITHLSERWTTDSRNTNKIAGLHYIRRIDRPEGGCVRMITTGGCGIADGGGFVYSADWSKPPQGRGGPDSYSHIFGPWWQWETDY